MIKTARAGEALWSSQARENGLYLIMRYRPFSLSKNFKLALVSGIIEETGGVFMERWKSDGRKDVVIVDLDALVPKEHLLRKIERVMD